MKFIDLKFTKFENVKPSTMFFKMVKRGAKLHYDPYFKLHDDRAVWLQEEYAVQMRGDIEVIVVALHPSYKQMLRDMLE
jgi:hypothetical protein